MPFSRYSTSQVIGTVILDSLAYTGVVPAGELSQWETSLQLRFAPTCGIQLMEALITNSVQHSQ